MAFRLATPGFAITAASLPGFACDVGPTTVCRGLLPAGISVATLTTDQYYPRNGGLLISTDNHADGRFQSGFLRHGGPYPRVELFSLEVTQGIQNLLDDVPLVAGRATWVRAHVRTTVGQEPFAGMGGQLVATRNGAALPGSPLGPVTAKIGVGKQPARAKLGDSFLFKLPPSWLQGDLKLTFKSPTDDVLCVDQTRACGGFFPFHKAPKLKLHFVPISWSYRGKTYAPGPAEFTRIVKRLEEVFPIVTVQVSVDADVIRWSSAIDSFTDVIRLDAAVAKKYKLDHPLSATVNKGVPIYLGVFTGPTLTIDGIALGGVAVSNLESATATPRYTAPHEIAHVLGRAHTPCGLGTLGTITNALAMYFKPDPAYPYPRALIGTDVRLQHTYWGFNIFSRAIYQGRQTHDLMSYCLPQWISSYTYNGVRKALLKRFG